MADNNTEKQRVQELTNKLEQGLQDLFNSDSYRNYLSTMSTRIWMWLWNTQAPPEKMTFSICSMRTAFILQAYR